MKTCISWLLALILLAGACMGFSEETAPQEDLKALYEEQVLSAMRIFTYYATNERNRDWAVKVVLKGSPAWTVVENYDYGWWNQIKKHELLDVVTDDYTMTEDGALECDYRCLDRVTLSFDNMKVEFDVGYHLRFENTGTAEAPVWMIMDYFCLPSEDDRIAAETVNPTLEGMELFTVTGKTYKGFALKVADPSRVKAGAIKYFSDSGYGWRVNEFAEKLGAQAVINGGSFVDGTNKKNGSVPLGCVITDGDQRRKNTPHNSECCVVTGFDTDNKMHVGIYSEAELQALDLRDALAFQSGLVSEGERWPLPDMKSRYRYSARTALGQDAEGNVYLVVIKGRQPDSLGATFDDMADLFLELGCVNAGLMDGGHSTSMFLNGQSIYHAYRYDVSRRLPTVFYVK